MKKPTFRNKKAKDFFNLCSQNPNCYESGIDSKGKIYFAMCNGLVSRETRAQFIKRAHKYYESKNK